LPPSVVQNPSFTLAGESFVTYLELNFMPDIEACHL
jgi:hypothetical protein